MSRYNFLRDWLTASPGERHRPPHGHGRGLALFLTASTYQRVPHLAVPERRTQFLCELRQACEEYGIRPVAWVVLKEHYHAVLMPEDPESVSHCVRTIHRRTATRWNREDGLAERQCWYQHWDRSLWTPGDVLSRINYVHRNPVKHGYVSDPSAWEWSSYREFEGLSADDAMLEELSRFPAPLKLPGDDF